MQTAPGSVVTHGAPGQFSTQGDYVSSGCSLFIVQLNSSDDRKAPMAVVDSHLLIRQTHAEVWNEKLMCPFIHFSDKSQ